MATVNVSNDKNGRFFSTPDYGTCALSLLQLVMVGAPSGGEAETALSKRSWVGTEFRRNTIVGRFRTGILRHRACDHGVMMFVARFKYRPSR